MILDGDEGATLNEEKDDIGEADDGVRDNELSERLLDTWLLDEGRMEELLAALAKRELLDGVIELLD